MNTGLGLAQRTFARAGTGEGAARPGRARRRGGRAGRLAATLAMSSTAVLASPCSLRAASVSVGPGETYRLAADMALDPADNFVAEGTADAPCTIEGNSFRITAAAFTGAFIVRHCAVIGLGLRGNPGLDLDLRQSGQLRLEDSTFSQSGELRLSALDDAAVAILRNDFQPDAAVDVALTDFTRSEPAIHLLGMGLQTQLFQGNRVLRSYVKLDGTQHWQIGGLSEGLGNVLSGERAGLDIESSQDVLVEGNYLRTPFPWNGFDQLTPLRVADSGAIIVEDNVLRGGNGIVQAGFSGQIRYNLIADPHGAWWISGARGAADLQIHHNLLVRSEADETGALALRPVGLAVTHAAADSAPTADPRLEFFNNTVDGADCYNPPGAGLAVEGLEIIKSVRNNLFTRLPYTNAAVAAYAAPDQLAPPADPGPAQMLYADYNDFFNRAAAAADNYALSVAGKRERQDGGFGLHDPGAAGRKDQQVDPRLAGPQPRVFPFDDDSLASRAITVCQVLAYYRARYQPAAGSPLIDAGDVADGAGTDIGAIGAGVAQVDDRFGLDCPADISALPPPLSDAALVCARTAPASTGAPDWLCVCSLSRPPSAGGWLPLLALSGVALVRSRRRRRARLVGTRAR
jgi:hypothetical protein